MKSHISGVILYEETLYQKAADGSEKYFNKTEPQKFNAQTLPPNFSPEQGHQIVGGQMIPLASFPEGDFRLEIKVTDNKVILHPIAGTRRRGPGA